MTNKKEAKIICSRNCTYNSKDCEKGCETFKDVLQMSKWKDEQYNEEKKELLGLVNMLPIDETNQTIIEDLKGLLK